MTRRVQIVLAAILLLLFCLDFIWGAASHFDIDYGNLRFIALFGLLPLSVGVVYSVWRRDDRVASVMFGIAFLLLFAPLCTLLNYMAISVAGPRIDDLLASYDRAMGIDWPGLMTFFLERPFVTAVLGLIYSISAFQVAAAIAVIGYRSEARDIALICIATVICAWSTIAFWTAAPSLGAYTVYDVSAIGRKLGMVIDRSYPDFLVWVLAHGPGRIDALNAKGLIGFPSFHTQEVIIAWWYLRRQPRPVFVAVSIFSLLALAAVPVQGGHHVIDVFGGIAFAAAGIWAAPKILRLIEGRMTLSRPLATSSALESNE